MKDELSLHSLYLAVSSSGIEHAVKPQRERGQGKGAC